MPRRVPDLTKVRQLIGYEPKVQLNEIITKVIEYFRHQRVLTYNEVSLRNL